MTMDEPRKLDPTFDVNFQLLFGSDGRLLVSLVNGLTAVPSGLRLRELTLMPQLQVTRSDGKRGQPDIRAFSVLGDRFSIDMQRRRRSHYVARMIYYLTGLFQTQLLVGEDYERLRRAVGVHILNFTLLPDDPDYHHPLHLRKPRRAQLTDLVELHIIELSKFKVPFAALRTEQEKWIYLCDPLPRNGALPGRGAWTAGKEGNEVDDNLCSMQV